LHRDEIPPPNTPPVDLENPGALRRNAWQRMLSKGGVAAKGGTTAGNRRARRYQLTAAGGRQLAVEMSQFERVIGAITRVMEAV